MFGDFMPNFDGISPRKMEMFNGYVRYVNLPEGI